MSESNHARILKRLIAARRQELLETLGTGYAKDHTAYELLVGQIQGLADAVKLSDDADYEINGGD